ncbi:MAG: glycoside hydrolase [Gemmatimonadetes bacterium]|nr:glycoside hydrolase [Gemmatimonadota bacterium]
MTRGITTVLFALAVFAAGAEAQTGTASRLEETFRTPPDAAKPRVWWHWMNGNVTTQGITADLEWMKRVGIGGMQMFDGSLGTPQFVDDRLVWMTPQWKQAFQHAAKEADRLGLEMTMAASGGWSETGGPWVKPEQAMKKLVWSETRVSGPRRFAAKLAAPPSNNGPFQGMRSAPGFGFPPEKDLPGAKPMAAEPAAAPDLTYYADVKVIAYRLPESDASLADARPRFTTPAGDVDAAALMDGDYSKTIPFALPEGAPETWVQLEFATPYHAEALTLAGAPAIQFVGGLPIPEGRFESSQDGKSWTTLVTLPGAEPTSAVFAARTYTFAPTTARFYRVVMNRPRPNPIGASFGMPAAKSIDLSELDLTGGPRVNRWQEKALYGLLSDYGHALATPTTNAAVRTADVIDITSHMKRDGTLDWSVPAGRWAVLRLGYSLEGTKNHPASPEATGYEVDKLNRAHVASYIDHYTSQIRGALGPLYGKSFRYLLLDSYEAGMENWTDDMIAQFRARRGYDPTRYLPVLVGRVVGSAAESDKFLWDFRRTVADLFADNHYGTIADALRKQGLGLYAEAMGADFPTSGEGLQDKGRATIPMAEFWTPGPGQDDGPNHMADMKEAASSAHIYGKPIVAAESFTTMPPPLVPAFSQSPFYLKRLADRALAHGINRFVIHTSVHQPFTDSTHKPGMTLGFFGQHYSRNNTWAEQAVAWNTYLARASHLLQQGRFVADLAYFYGEGAPNAVPYWKPVQPAFPAGYDYDWLNAEVLAKAEVRAGRLVLPSGMSYRALVLPADVTQLTLPMARKLRALVAAGATVIAAPPSGSPSLSDGAAGDDSVRAIARAVWGNVDGTSVTEHGYGSGRVYWGKPVGDVLAAMSVAPDVTFGGDSSAKFAWIHRRAGDVDIYFVANQRDAEQDVATSFRASGREPELWDAATGETQSASYTIGDGRTDLSLHLDPYGSTFVVFRRPTSVASRELGLSSRTVLATLSGPLATASGPWAVRFQPNRGAPAEVQFDSLASWTTSRDAGVKYFSGTATYAKDVNVPAAAFQPGATIEIDLGTVHEIAELSVNGTPIGGILWKPPYRADITRALHAGTNRIEVRVTNLWPNRMIGDLQPGVTKTYTFTDFRPFTKDSRLLESGLLGPVRLERVTLVQRAQSLKGGR